MADADPRNRTTHYGSQPISSVRGLEKELEAKQPSDPKLDALSEAVPRVDAPKGQVAVYHGDERVEFRKIGLGPGDLVTRELAEKLLGDHTGAAPASIKLGGSVSLTALASASGASLVGTQFSLTLENLLTLTMPFTPEQFGAKGDGATDDYAALQALAAAVNAAGGGWVRFKRGATYFVGQKVVSGNAVADITWTNLNGLFLDFNGATIKLVGGWDRDVSTTKNITPFLIQDSQNIITRNGTIDGGGATITNSSAALVPASYGFRFASCNNVIRENMHTRYCLADGVTYRESATTVGGVRLACRNVTEINCTSKFNARIAMSQIQVRNMTSIDCDYGFSGYLDEVGTLTGFLNSGGPACSIDIEPGNTPSHGNLMDVKTGEITFKRCKLRGNTASAVNAWIFANGEYYIEEITFEDCLIEANDGTGGGSDMMTFDCPGGRMRGCTIDARDRTCYIGYNVNSAAAPDMDIGPGNIFKGRTLSSLGILNSRAMLGGRLTFHHNKFICYHTAQHPGSWLVQFANPYCTLDMNEFWLPKEAYSDNTGTDIAYGVQMLGRRSQNNRFETDLLAASGSSGTAHYGIIYGTATIVRGDRLLGTATGWADTMRPGTAATNLALTWDTNFLFNSNQRMNQATKDWASLANGVQQSQTITVADAAIGDKADATMSIALGGTLLSAEVTAANTVTVYQNNSTGGAVDLASGTLYANVTRRTG